MAIVGAVIVHVSGRALALQRIDDDRWHLPGGPVAAGVDRDAALRAHVRAATGFEIRDPIVTGRYATPEGMMTLVRCGISGVGADITSQTRTMRWMDRAAIVAHMDPLLAPGMVEALEAGADIRPAATVDEAPTLLAG